MIGHLHDSAGERFWPGARRYRRRPKSPVPRGSPATPWGRLS